MNIVRLLASYVEDGNPTGSKLILHCGIDENHRLIDREWFGVIRNQEPDDHGIHPFIMTHGTRLDFNRENGDEEYYETINLNQKELCEGEYFTISPSDNEWQSTYRIDRITPLAD